VISGNCVLTIALYRPGDPGKNKFCWRGGSPPIWGDMGGLKFSTGVYFDPTFLNSLVRFRNFFAHRQLPPPLGMLKIWSKSDERNSRNVRPKLVPQPSTFAFWPSVTPHSSPYDVRIWGPTGRGDISPLGLSAFGLSPLDSDHAKCVWICRSILWCGDGGGRLVASSET